MVSILLMLVLNSTVIKNGDEAFIKQQYDEAIGIY